MHIGLSADVYEAVRYIRQMFPDAPVFLVGFSIGAYTMTKYVGEADSGVWPEGQHWNDLLLLHACMTDSTVKACHTCKLRHAVT